MKKLSILLFSTLLFFTLKSFGKKHLLLPTGGNIVNTPFLFPGDTGKKAQVTDTTKKAADSDSSDAEDDNVRSYGIGVDYGSDQSFHGIHSTSKIPYIQPNFTYTAPSGFYMLVSVQDILIKKGGGFDAWDLNPGWDISLADNTILNFNFSHYTFKQGTPVTIRSDLSDAFATYIDQWIGETEGKFTVAYDYYKQTSDSIKTPGDIVLTPDIAHTFKIKLSKKSSLSLVPEGSIDFGTRNAYSQYEVNAHTGETYIEVKGKNGKETKQLVDPNNSSFGTLDYSFVFTITYKIGNFEFEPAYNYTQSLYQVKGVPITPLKYVTISILYTIK